MPVRSKAVRLSVRLKTGESDVRLKPLADLVARYRSLDSLGKPAIADYLVARSHMGRSHDY